MNSRYEEFKKILIDKGFDIDIESYDRLKEFVKKYSEKNDILGLISFISSYQNCGGYALQIPICIFSNTKLTFEEDVLRILELYPFVRLLGDSQLADDEYIVEYRAGKRGHHFIRVDENGVATEKHESELPQLFAGWGTLKNDEEAVFAVKKQEARTEEMKQLPQCNVDMFLNDNIYYINLEEGTRQLVKRKANKPVTFEDVLKSAYNENNKSFLYLDRTFELINNEIDAEVLNICFNKEIFGKAFLDNDDLIIELDDQKKKMLFGYQPTKPITIKNKIKEKNNDWDMDIIS